MIFAALLFAAIITERNDLWTYPPNYAVFEGDALDPGIAPQWIPYGTFTQGIGSNEYLRVTSNLTGVVASSFDGYYERSYVPLQDFDPTNHWSFDEKVTLTPLYHDFTNFVDNGEFLESATNNSLRILDRLNAEYFLGCISNNNQTYAYRRLYTGLLEPNLAHEENTYSYPFHNGVARGFGSRTLDNLVYETGATLEPLISVGWSPELPFKASDSNEWAGVWPIYSTLTNDIHFFPASGNDSSRYYRWHLGSMVTAPQTHDGWFYPQHLSEIWGGDVYGNVGTGTGADLEIALSQMPLQFDMEDVLSVDTGWKYEYPPVVTGSYWTVWGPLGNFRLNLAYDAGSSKVWDNYQEPYPTNYYVEITYADGSGYELYIFDIPTSENVYQYHVAGGDDEDYLALGDYHAQRTLLISNQDDYRHWRNMTRRLDWKRLGIICQLERQMEQTYKPRQEEDYIPLFDSYATVTRNYTAGIEVPIVDDEGYIVATTNFNASGASWIAGAYTTRYETNSVGMSYPMARLSPVEHSGKILANMGSSWTLQVAKSEFENLMEGIVSDVAAAEMPGDGTMNIQLAGEIIPSGNKLIWTWEVAFCDFFPTGGGSIITYQTSASGTELYGINISEADTNAVVFLDMSLSKFARTRYTLATASEKNQFLENLIPYPQTNTWRSGFVAEQTRPTLEVMLDAKGSNNVALIESDNPLGWQYLLSRTNTAHRQFRMSPDSQSADTFIGSNNRRWVMVQGLNQSVRNNFRSIAKFEVDAAAAALAQFAQGEEAAIQAQLEAQDMQMTADLALAETNNLARPTYLVATAYSNVTTSTVQSTSLHHISFRADEKMSIPYYDAIDDAYTLGYLHFTITEANITNEVINVDPVRVDAHQDQMIKTLWRFKNLRDPDL